MIDKALENNILRRIARLEEQVRALQMRSAEADTLSEMTATNDLEFRTVDENGQPRFVMTADGDGALQEFGVKAHLIGVDNANNVQFYVDADTGKLYAAGGAISFSVRGLTIEDYPLIIGKTIVNKQGGGTSENEQIIASQSGRGIISLFPDTYSKIFSPVLLSGVWESQAILLYDSGDVSWDGWDLNNNTPAVNVQEAVILEVSGNGPVRIIVRRMKNYYYNAKINLTGLLRLPLFAPALSEIVIYPGTQDSNEYSNILVTRVKVYRPLAFSTLNEPAGIKWGQAFPYELSQAVLKYVKDEFVGGSSTSGNIGNLGWKLPAGSVTAYDGGSGGIVLSSTGTAGEHGRIILTPAAPNTKKLRVSRMRFIVSPETGFSAGGNIAVGIFDTIPGPTTPAGKVVVYADNTSTGNWKVSQTDGSFIDTGVQASLSKKYVIDFIYIGNGNMFVYINGDLVAQTLTDSIGYIMARAYTSNATEKKIGIHWFEAILGHFL